MVCAHQFRDEGLGFQSFRVNDLLYRQLDLPGPFDLYLNWFFDNPKPLRLEAEFDLVAMRLHRLNRAL